MEMVSLLMKNRQASADKGVMGGYPPGTANFSPKSMPRKRKFWKEEV